MTCQAEVLTLLTECGITAVGPPHVGSGETTMTSSHNGTSRPFTVALYTSCTTGAELAVVEELRATIRRCKHGVLVTTACMLDPLTCAARPHSRPPVSWPESIVQWKSVT